eukprot:TRINITY_DN5118_c0_g1_i1.p1 TRINITY_DN5118_c0_g1~~TRINITY_DN5118_c0_g1_i1.p1  ORF type:complete len:89 (-),score=14.35 TRINITY_DN5118_c0_g1_i1:29-295(-)
MHLRYGGFVVAVLVMIIGVVCLSQEEYAVGAVVVLLGFLLRCSWFLVSGPIDSPSMEEDRTIFGKGFKKMGDKYPGISYEFHVQGHTG